MPDDEYNKPTRLQYTCGIGHGPYWRRMPDDGSLNWNMSRWMTTSNLLKPKRNLLYRRISPYRAVNTFHHGYKNQSVGVV